MENNLKFINSIKMELMPMLIYIYINYLYKMYKIALNIFRKNTQITFLKI